MDINFWENVLFLTAIFPDHFQKIPRMLRQIPVFPIGGDGSCEGRFMADGKAEGAVSGVLVFMVEIALRGEGSADASIARWIDMEEFLVWRETGGLMLYL